MRGSLQDDVTSCIIIIYHLILFHMTTFYKGTLLFLSWLLCATYPIAKAQAQNEINNWYFGAQAAVNFSGGTAAPTAVAGSAMTSYEGCASISTGAGQLVMYSNGEQVWDAAHQVMPNGGNLGGHNSASQGALLLRAPGSTTLYYLFTVDAIDNNLVGGLNYSIIDLSLRGGLGDVTATKTVRLPTPTLTGKVTEKLSAALHSNGRDYWIIVHGWQSNAFYSFLLSPTGISTAPITSNVGPVHQGGGSFFGAANAVGCMRVSPNGAKLALAQRDTQFELYDYNNSTGIVSNGIILSSFDDMYSGIAFSPDNSRLYTTAYSAGGATTSIYQYNMLAGSASAIRASQTQLANITGLSVAIQLAPNGKIYLAAYNRNSLNSIEQPNLLGSACNFRVGSIPLGGKLGQNGLPNFPNAFSAATPTATSAQLSQKTLVFPNPAHNRISMVLPVGMNKQNTSIELINLIGQIVHRQSMSNSLQEGAALVLPLPELTKGVYVMRVIGAADVIEKKIIIE
jgi:hypothetical protein